MTYMMLEIIFVYFFSEPGAGKGPSHVYELGEIVAALSTGVVNEKYMELFQTDEIESLFTKPVRWTLDGEDSGEEDKVKIRVVKNAMYIMV